MCAVYCEGKRRFLPGNASAGVQRILRFGPGNASGVQRILKG